MSLSLQLDCTFTGPALPEPYVKFELEAALRKLNLLPKETGKEGEKLTERWELTRTKLRKLVAHGGNIRVQNHILDPLTEILGYDRVEDGGEISTEEEMENGGVLMRNGSPDSKLRAWATDLHADLDAPEKRGLASRFSAAQRAERVLRTCGEKVGLLTNGSELRLIISDPGRVRSTISIAIDPHWKRSRELPDSLRLLIALASPAGIKALPTIIEAARLQQAKVTKDLRKQAREAIEGFIQEVLDNPKNREWYSDQADKEKLAKQLWHEGLILIYRLLFVLKLEATDDPARTFNFAASTLWRHSFSPSAALAPYARKVIDHGAETGHLLEHGLRALFRMLGEGLQCTELTAKPVGGALFAPDTTPLLTKAQWGERAVAKLLDQLLWTTPAKNGPRQRVHYGPLDVEDLGRVYEALLELDPGITVEPMCRLRRSKLEVVVPLAQGEKYRPKKEVAETDLELDDDAEEEEEESSNKKTKVLWIEEIKPGRFYLRVGLGRKATGSFYTPHTFVRFLVQEVLGKLVERVCPLNDPDPCAILRLKVIDKAMGSGHFLVEACRFLAEKLYEAARRCDEIETELKRQADNPKLDQAEKKALLEKAEVYHKRVVDLPDPNDEMLQYLPSKAPERGGSGYSMFRALALSRRMVAVHCIYGVDRNRLAVELAKLALWIECHAEGMPLTFLDHRLVVGDSLTGPFFGHLLKYPGTQQKMDDLFTRGLTERLTEKLGKALEHVRELERSVGTTLAEVQAKEAAKARLDEELAPFKALAAAWAGGVMLGTENCDDTAYAELAKQIAKTGELPEELAGKSEMLCTMIAKGSGLQGIKESWPELRESILKLPPDAIPALPFDLVFPEVFYPTGSAAKKSGFDADLGNPPWDRARFERKEVIGSFWLPILEATRTTEWEEEAESFLNKNPKAQMIVETIERDSLVLTEFLANHYPTTMGKDSDVEAPGDKDLYLFFVERAYQILKNDGGLGLVTGGGLAKNTAAAGLRKLLVSDTRLEKCLHFVNLNQLFEDLPPIIEFCIITSGRYGQRAAFQLASELRENDALLRQNQAKWQNRQFTDLHAPQWAFLTGKTYTTGEGQNLKEFISFNLKSFTRELDKSQDDSGFVTVKTLLPDVEDARPWKATKALLQKGAIPLRGSRTFHVLSPCPSGLGGKRSPAITLAVPLNYPKAARFLRRVQYYRLGIRRHVGSIHTNERSLVPCIFTPASIANDQIIIEGEPWNRPNSTALIVAAVLAAFTTEAQIRQNVGAMMTLGVLASGNAPQLHDHAKRFLAHSALRCLCVDEGYKALWEEQLNQEWREKSPKWSWPIIEEDSERWQIRAAIDSIVGKAYGLNQQQYKSVLGEFSHSSHKQTPKLCLEKFEELEKVGLEKFCKKYDSYWDIPLNEELPKPVIDLPIPEPEKDAHAQGEFALSATMEGGNSKKQKRKRN